MRESRLMLLQYATALIAVVLVSVHLIMQGVVVPYRTAISFGNILSIYKSWIYAVFLESLLVVVLVHGFNGLRIILSEFKQSRPWTTWVDIGTVLAVVVTVAYGTRTVILAIFGGVS